MTHRQDKSSEICNQAYKYLDKNIRNLIEIYSGRWVIIYDNRVVDSDVDEWELAKRAEIRGRFDLKYVTPICYIPKTYSEYLKDKRVEKEQLRGQRTCEFLEISIDGVESLEGLTSD